MKRNGLDDILVIILITGVTIHPTLRYDIVRWSSSNYDSVTIREAAPVRERVRVVNLRYGAGGPLHVDEDVDHDGGHH